MMKVLNKVTISIMVALCMMLCAEGQAKQKSHSTPKNRGVADKNDTVDNKSEAISIVEGRSVLVDSIDVAKVLVSNPNVVKVVPANKKSLMITGKQAGNSDVVKVRKDGGALKYTVTVLKSPVSLTQGLAPKVGIINPELKRLFPNSRVAVRMDGDALFLEGVAATTSDLDGILNYLKSYTNKIVNLTQTGDYKQVNLEVKMVEVNKTKMKNLGLNFLGTGPSASIGIFSANTLSSYSLGRGSFTIDTLTRPIDTACQILLGIGDVSAIISILEGNQIAKTLTNPSVVAEDGKEAKLFVGGSIPVPVPQTGGTIAIEWKDFGIRLEFHPKVLPDGKIKLKLKAESGGLSETKGISLLGTNVPAIETRRIENELTIEQMNNIVIGGLFFTRQMRNNKGLPGLANIPVLGVFFKKIEDSDEEQELIAIITPKFVTPSMEKIKILEKVEKIESSSWKDIVLSTKSGGE
jgi:pilus assembly protein CpaC